MILENFDLMLKFEEFKTILYQEQYLFIFKEVLDLFSNLEIHYLALKILAQLAEIMEA